MKEIIEKAVSKINLGEEKMKLKKYSLKDFEKLIQQVEKNVSLFSKLKTKEEKKAIFLAGEGPNSGCWVMIFEY